MNKEIGNRIARFFYLNLKKWDEIRFEGVFLIRDTLGESFDNVKNGSSIITSKSLSKIHSNKNRR